MPSFEFNGETVEFEVFCARCGRGICNESDGGNTPRRNLPFVNVHPCKKCMANEREEGAEEGRAEMENP